MLMKGVLLNLPYSYNMLANLLSEILKVKVFIIYWRAHSVKWSSYYLEFNIFHLHINNIWWFPMRAFSLFEWHLWYYCIAKWFSVTVLALCKNNILPFYTTKQTTLNHTFTPWCGSLFYLPLPRILYNYSKKWKTLFNAF